MAYPTQKLITLPSVVHMGYTAKSMETNSRGDPRSTTTAETAGLEDALHVHPTGPVPSE